MSSILIKSRFDNQRFLGRMVRIILFNGETWWTLPEKVEEFKASGEIRPSPGCTNHGDLLLPLSCGMCRKLKENLHVNKHL